MIKVEIIVSCSVSREQLRKLQEIMREGDSVALTEHLDVPRLTPPSLRITNIFSVNTDETA